GIDRGGRAKGGGGEDEAPKEPPHTDFHFGLLFLRGRRYGWRFALRHPRDIEFDFAAAIVARVLGSLLVFDFAVDDDLEVRPLDGLGDAAAVDEHGGRARDVESARFLDFLLHFRLRGLAVYAGAELDGVHILGVFGPAQHLGLEVLRRDGVLVGVDPVVIFPEAVGLLLEDAAAGHGGRFGPGVEAFDGKVLEVEAHLGGVVLDQVLADHLGFALAERALHVAEQHDGDRGAGGSQRGL